MVAPGQLVAVDGVIIGDPPDTTTVSYWVSGLCSPFVSFGERAERYVSAVRLGDHKGLQSATNTNFGEVFAPAGGDVPEWQEVANHKGSYLRGEVPDGVVILTLVADIQGNRIYWTIRGWGARGEESADRSWRIVGLDRGGGRLGRPGRAGDGADRRHAAAPGHDRFRFPAGQENRAANQPDL